LDDARSANDEIALNHCGSERDNDRGSYILGFGVRNRSSRTKRPAEKNHQIDPISERSLWWTISALLFASSDFAVAGFFGKHRTKTQFVVDQSKSVFLRKLRELCFTVFFIFWPDALQFVFVDSAMAELVGFELQLTPD
jgi:hypothetical protein